jgi:tetratricopeptide (TPR) repeat protein
MAKRNKVLTKKHSLRAAKLLQEASAYRQTGHIKEAVTLCVSILDKYPNYHDAMLLLGIIAHQIGQYDLAISHFERTLAIKPNFANAHNDLGLSLQALGRFEEAKTCYERALAIKPDFAVAKNNLGNIFRELGQVEEAIACYEKALAINHDFLTAHYNLAMTKPKKEQVPIIEKLLTSFSISEKDVMHCYFALGNIFDSTNSFTKAFEHYLKGNMLKRKTITYDSKKHSEYVERLIKIYSKKYFQEKSKCISDSKLPVFIVGMPRSGTTLIEQIISNHPQIHGAGELLALERIEKTIAKQFEQSRTYPECMSLCKESTLTRLSDDYLKEIRNYSQDANLIIDKMPDNFLRIGLIKTLFPQARIIHCFRNAMDTCTSIFLNYFVNGNKYSFDLTEIGQYYLDYTKLMEHWSSLFQFEIHNVQYEKLVMNQEIVSRQLFEYLGLEWDDNYLDFHKNKRGIRTTSNLQVRQPIYRNSINRWKNYEKQLNPLTTIINHSS